MEDSVELKQAIKVLYKYRSTLERDLICASLSEINKYADKQRTNIIFRDEVKRCIQKGINNLLNDILNEK